MFSSSSCCARTSTRCWRPQNLELGDYLSGTPARRKSAGLGIAPGANIGDTAAVFEATHGTAPKYAGQDKINPGSVMLFWRDASSSTSAGTRSANASFAASRARFAAKTVTYDFARQMQGATQVSSSKSSQQKPSSNTCNFTRTLAGDLMRRLALAIVILAGAASAPALGNSVPAPPRPTVR